MRRAAILASGLIAGAVFSAPVAMSPTNAVYYETFGGLPDLGTGISYSWINDNAVNRTLSGWYSAMGGFGEAWNASGLKIYTTETGKSFGVLVAADSDPGIIGVVLTNGTGSAVANLSVAYDVFAPRTNAARTEMYFDYCIRPGVPIIGGETGWVNLPSRSYSVSNNLPRDRSVGVIPESVPDGSHIMLRWRIPVQTSADTIAIDNLKIQWAPDDSPDPVEPLPPPPDVSGFIPVPQKGIRETFDSMVGTISNLTTTVFGWRVNTGKVVRTVGSYTNAQTFIPAKMTASGSMSSSATAGFYNFAAGEEGDESLGSDRALGGLLSSNIRTVSLYGAFRNATGSAVDEWSLAFDIEKYRNGSNATLGLIVFFSTDGETWSELKRVSFAADADNSGAVVVPIETQPINFTFLNPLEPETPFYLAWSYTALAGSTTSNAKALGIDNVVLAPVAKDPTLLIAR